jgi:peptidoglycan/LPS O-acetylase OafA/YrhL
MAAPAAKAEAVAAQHTPAPASSPVRARADASAHLPALDGVRGCAVLLVMIFHFATSMQAIGFVHPVLAVGQIGWLGVDVFFALSGFLITGILLDSKTSPSYFTSFYARRLLRILPLYYGATLIVLALWALIPEAGVWGARTTPFAAASPMWPALFLENVSVAVYGASPTGVLTHFWSLAVEEHFYLLWPTLVWLCSRRRLGQIAAGAIAISIAGRIYVLAADLDATRLFGLTPLRMDGLAIGALAALLARSPLLPRAQRLAPAVLAASSAALAAIFLASGAVEQEDPPLWIASYPLAALATAAALIAATAGGRIARQLAFAPLRWFGKYSYGLYVWHPIVGMLLFHSRVSLVGETPGPARMLAAAAVAFALNIALAWLSFHLWERRFLALKRFFPAWPDAATARPSRLAAQPNPTSAQ